MAEYLSFFKTHREELRQWFVHLPLGNPTFGGPSWEGARGRVLILRLSPYRDVDRSASHLVLSREAAAAGPGFYVDFAFFPSRADRELFEGEGIPLFTGIRSFRGMEDFDLVLASNSFGLELFNLARAFLVSGIPAFASERAACFPPVVLGGSNAAAAQALFRADAVGGRPGPDCMADAVFFGEGEGAVSRIVTLLADPGRVKEERLEAAARAEIPGLWVRGFPRKAKKAVASCLNGAAVLDAYPVLNGEEASTARLQISFGCPFFCTFCFEGHDRKPYREVPAEELIAAAKRLKRNTGAKVLELYSFNFNTHTEIFRLLGELDKLFFQVNFMSQRVDFLLGTPGLLAAETAAGKTSFTLGIEGISARIRAFYRKGLVPDAADTAAERLFGAKAREIKLFYVLSGHENEDDFAEFRAFVKRLRERRRCLHPGTRVLFSFGLLVRMPFTPLRYDRLFLREEDWKLCIAAVKRDVETHGFEFRLAAPWDEYALTQVLALGGGLSDLLLRLAEEGVVYDKGLAAGVWERAKALAGSRIDALGAEKSRSCCFPLDDIVEGPDDFLYRRYLEAKEALAGGSVGDELTASCFEAGDGGCLGCGACPDELSRQGLLRHAVKPPDDPARFASDLGSLVKRKRSAPGVRVVLEVPRGFAGAEAPWLEAWALRTLFASAPETSDYVFAARLTRPDPDRAGKALWYGRAVFEFLTLEPERLKDVLSAPQAAAQAAAFTGTEDEAEAEFFALEVSGSLPLPAVRAAFLRALAGQYLPGTLVHESGGGSRYALSPKALKKKSLLSLRFVPPSPDRPGDRDSVLAAELQAASKFDCFEFVSALGKELGRGAEVLCRRH